MNFVGFVVLFGIMAVLAAVPSTSVAIVVSRSITCGFSSGVAAALGIVTGDLLFVVLAIAGLTTVATALGEYFIIAKYLGGLYLIWFGISLLRRKTEIQQTESTGASLLRSYLAGLMFTLGDLKAVFFYASLFPVLVEVEQLTFSGITAIALATVVTVGAVKLGYAYAAHKMGVLARKRRHGGVAMKIAGSVSIGAGMLVLARA
ncbi:MAG: LysE family translocator [Candidatus Competibacteraceae bacterium]|nr:LysE family translocator [Candidatus Competibacteraceae bacterium]